MWRTAWSADGAHVLYSFSDGDAGANGIWAFDIASGNQRVVYASGAGAPSAGPDGSVMFSTFGGETGFIFVGHVSGGYGRVLTDGSSPVWHYER
jgi:hypothetical protein